MTIVPFIKTVNAYHQIPLDGEFDSQLKSVVDGKLAKRALYSVKDVGELGDASYQGNQFKLQEGIRGLAGRNRLKYATVSRVIESIVDVEVGRHAESNDAVWQDILGSPEDERRFRRGLSLELLNQEALVVRLASAIEQGGGG